MKLRFLFVCVGCLLFAVDTLQAAPPATLAFDGRIETAQGVPVNSQTNFIFRIYDTETSGEKLWEEIHTGVTVTNGIFSVILGKTTSLASLAFDKTYYISVEPNNGGEMSPRLEMTSAPYAMNTVKQTSNAAETLLKTLTTPESVTVSPSGSGLASVSWNAVKGATSYNLYLATETGVNASNYTTKANGRVITGVTSPYTVTGLTNGVTYFFAVASLTSIVESTASLETTTKITACTTGFCDNGDGTITDKSTGLVGLKNANCFGVLSWSSALSAVAKLASGQCGLTDGSVAGKWRLLSEIELPTYVAWKKSGAFTGVQTVYYWSSSNWIPGSSSYAYGVYLGNGEVRYIDQSSANYVWPVRDGQ